MSEVLRTFIALDPDPNARAWLSGFLEALRARHQAARWVRPEHLHLTVKFLGNVAVERIPEIEQVCTKAAAGSGPLCLELGRPGSFGPRKVPRTLWMGFQPCPALAALARLHQRLEDDLAKLGFPPEGRRWTPHLTLGRNPRSAPMGGWEGLLPPWRAGGKPRLLAAALDLYSSDLRPEGPIHTLIRSERLGGAAVSPAAPAEGRRP